MASVTFHGLVLLPVLLCFFRPKKVEDISVNHESFGAHESANVSVSEERSVGNVGNETVMPHAPEAIVEETGQGNKDKHG